MYDIKHAQLVFVTQTHHPVLEYHTGYIFAEYEIHYRKPRELFFSHIHEAHLYCLRTGAEFIMDPLLKPDVVTALDYVKHGLEDNMAGAIGTGWGEGISRDTLFYRKRKAKRQMTEPLTDVSAWEAEEEAGTGLGATMAAGEVDGDVTDIDYFGD